MFASTSFSPTRLSRRSVFFYFLLSLIAWSFFASQAHAANRYWVGRQRQADVNYPLARNWESTSNWSATPKGASGATVPGASDIAIFNFSGSGNTVLLHSNVSVSGLSMTNAFTGTFLQGTGALNIGSEGFRMGSGTFVGSGALRITGAGLTQTGGIIKQGYGAVGTIHTMSGSFLKSGSKSFYTNTGTLILNGAADQNFQLDRAVLWNLTINNTGGSTSDDIVVSSGSLALSGALTVTLGNLDLTTNSIAMIVERGITLADAAQATLTTNSAVTASGTILVNDAATITVTAGTWTLNDDGDQAVDLDGQSIFNLTLNDTGGGTNDDVIIAGGGLNLSGSLVVTLGNLDLTTNSQSLVTEKGITLADAAQATLASNTTIHASGTILVNDAATLSMSTGTLILNDDSDQSVDLDGQTLYNLTINNAGGGSNDDVSIDGGRLMVANDLTVTLGNLDLDTNNSVGAITGSLRIADSAQATMLVDQSLSLAGSFFIKKPAGGFTASGGTVLLNNTSQTLSGTITFYNLRKVIPVGGYSLFFYPGYTYTVSNRATLQGASSTSKMNLRSGSGGVRWTLAAATSPTLQYLDVKDSAATVKTDCVDCTDSGNNNVNWTFSASLPASTTSSSSTTTTSGGGGGRRAAAAATTATPTTPKTTTVTPQKTEKQISKEERQKIRAERKKKAKEKRDARKAARLAKKKR